MKEVLKDVFLLHIVNEKEEESRHVLWVSPVTIPAEVNMRRAVFRNSSELMLDFIHKNYPGYGLESRCYLEELEVDVSGW